MTSPDSSSHPNPARRVSRAELKLLAVCLIALSLLGAGVWMSRDKRRKERGALLPQPELRLTFPRARMASALVGDKLWVLGGQGSNLAPRADAEWFNLSSQSMALQRGTMSNSTLLARCDQTAEAHGTDIYIIGGMGAGRSALNTVEKLNTVTGLVTVLAPMPTSRRMAHSAIINGKIYVVGGGNVKAQRVGTLEIYDIKTNKWTKGAPMRVPREADVATWNGQLVVMGGYNALKKDKGVLTDVEIYNPATNTWRRLSALPQTVSAHHVVRSNDWLFTFGDYLTLSRVLAYNARTGQSRELFSTGFAPRRHTVAVAHAGRAFVVGGSTDDGRASFDSGQTFSLKRLQAMAEVKE